MKIKMKKRKFIRNIIIGIIALLVVAFIINIAPGYKRNKYKNVTNLVITDENVTENLKNPIYRDENGVLYLSMEDIQQFLDDTIYYEEENDIIITTSEVEVATMQIGEKSINIDGSNVSTLSTIIYNNDILYIPIEEMTSVYNIQVKYLESEDIVIIDKLNEGMIKAEAEDTTDIKFKPRSLSKEVGKLEEGEIVSAFYTTSKGWRLIRTETGIIGYVKANILTNEYILRQDIHQEIESKEISIDISHNATTNVDEVDIIIKDLFLITEEGILLKNVDYTDEDETAEMWANLTITNASISSYDERTKLIKNIESIARNKNIKGINVNIESDNEDLERFIIELAPRLREIGIITNVVINDQTQEINETYIGIVQYIIKKENL